jgi:RES domain-containing protein
VITAWRIVKQRHAAHAFDGEGARRAGGRWNSPGVPMVYTAGSQALAALELLVHLDRSALLAAYVLIPCEVEETLVATLDHAELPPHWRSSPPPHQLAVIGDRWARAARSVALVVPSAVVPDESIVLLNPAHPAYAGVRVGVARPFEVDHRLLAQAGPAYFGAFPFLEGARGVVSACTSASTA